MSAAADPEIEPYALDAVARCTLWPRPGMRRPARVGGLRPAILKSGA